MSTPEQLLDPLLLRDLNPDIAKAQGNISSRFQDCRTLTAGFGSLLLFLIVSLLPNDLLGVWLLMFINKGLFSA